jgi:poly(A) polymerase
MSVLQLIQKVTLEFVRHVSKKRKTLSSAQIDAAGGKIFTFGSYRLGVYGPGQLEMWTMVVCRLPRL